MIKSKLQLDNSNHHSPIMRKESHLSPLRKQSPRSSPKSFKLRATMRKVCLRPTSYPPIFRVRKNFDQIQSFLKRDLNLFKQKQTNH